jgi:hypothetical protein
MAKGVVSGLRQRWQKGRRNPRFGISTCRMVSRSGPRFLAIATILAGLASPVAGAEVNQPAISAAMGVWGYVEGVDIQIGKCRETDPANTDAYDLAAITYHQDTSALLLRIDMLLTTEVARAKAPEDFMSSRQKTLAASLRRMVEQRIEANRGLWIDSCRDLPDAAMKRISEFQPLRERYPEWMRLIDDWR